MDPMDFTMEDGQVAQQQQNAHRHQCQQPQYPPNPNNFTPQARDGQHYDPVHDSSAWYQPNNTNAQNRPTYTTQQNHPQWAAPAYVPIQNWQGFGEGQSGTQVPDPSSYRPQTNFTGIANSPWGDGRGYEGLPFGYASYTNPLSVGNPSSEHGTGRPHMSSASSLPQMPNEFRERMQQDMLRTRTNTFGGPSFPVSDRTPRQPDDEGASGVRATIHLSPTSHDRAAHARRLQHLSRAYASQDPSHHRRRTANNYSDDDDDLSPEPEDGRRRRGEFLFNPEDEERAMAAVRGALAASKKIPSKETIDALEVVDTKDLSEEEKQCIICYNELGVSNPDGITEQALRLPKCKHIFGDKCIRKWFEDSDSCPYCRDKLPAEVSINKKSMEALRRGGPGMYRSRNSFVPRYPMADEVSIGRNTTGNSPLSRDEYEYTMNRHNDWAYSPPNRSTPADSPDRRRQSRGRVGNTRSAQMLGRPTSVGSARFINPVTNHQSASQRALVLGLAPNNHATGNTPRRSITPGLMRGGPPPPSLSTTPPRNTSRLSSELSPTSQDASSPAVAVGSFAPPREQRLFDTFQREVRERDNSIQMSNESWAEYFRAESQRARTDGNEHSGFDAPSNVTSPGQENGNRLPSISPSSSEHSRSSLADSAYMAGYGAPPGIVPPGNF